MTLLNAKQNKIYTIKGVTGADTQTRRLLDMGFTPKTGIYVVGVSPMGGTVLVSMRGSLVGLREDAAALVEIEETGVRGAYNV